MQMPRKQPWIVFASLAVAAALPATARANDGLYAGFGGAINLMSPEDVLDPAGDVIVNNRLHDGFATGLTVGYGFAFGLRPEVEFGYRFNKIKSASSDFLAGTTASGHYQAYTEMLNLWYDFKSSDPNSALSFMHPYLGGGLGAAEVGVRENVGNFGDAVDDKKAVFAYQVGGGLAFDFTRQMTLSFDARWLRGQSANFGVSNSVIDQLGGTQYLATRYEGISLGASLRYSFFAPPAAASGHAPARDDNTITPVPMAQAAAPTMSEPDSDGDGVPDRLDKCPNTPKGFRVDGSGCIVQQTVVLRAVNFQFNSDQLTGAAKETLDPVAAGLLGQPSLRVEIDGHTDSKGSVAYNQKLSARRAESVRRYLIDKGVNPQMLSARGFGPSKPVASNDTEDGRAQNRRVEFVVLGGETSADTKITTGDSTDASKAQAQH